MMVTQTTGEVPTAAGDAGKEAHVDRTKMTHKERTNPDRLFAEYSAYFAADRDARDERTTGWDRLKLTWYNILQGYDGFESRIFSECLTVGMFLGFGYGALNDSVQRIRDFQRQHDEFVAAGLLKEKWQLTQTVMFRTAKSGVRMGLLCMSIPMVSLCACLSSIAYRNSVHPLDFGCISAATLAAFNLNKSRSVILRHSAAGFGVGVAAACATRLAMWVTETSVSDFRYWAVTRRQRSDEMLSRKSWERFKDLPDAGPLHEREMDMQAAWLRQKERLEAERLSGERKREPRYTRIPVPVAASQEAQGDK